MKTPATAVTGWVRFDSDQVIRGWASDRADRERRLHVDLRIDDGVVASLLADRLDPKLVSLGEGDGRYAFCFAVPDAFRDGRPHRFTAVTDDGLTLKCKTDSFDLPAESSEPRITIVEALNGYVEGQLMHGLYSKSVALELWRGDTRLDEALDAQLRGAPGRLSFFARLAPEMVEDNGSLVIAAPGMIEAGLPGGAI